MDYLSILAPKLVSFFILVLIGVLISRIGIVPQSGLSTLSALLIKLVLPCLVISLMHTRVIGFHELFSLYPFVLCQFTGYVLMALTGILCTKFAHIRPTASNVHKGCMVAGNFGFMIVPLIMALFTPENGQQYIPVAMATDTTTVWTIGLALFTSGIETDGAPWHKTLLKRFYNPVFISMAVMLTLNTLRLNIPAPVADVCNGIANISFSLGLIYLGCSMYYMKRGSRGYLRNASLLIITKQYAVPLLIYFLSSQFLTETECIVIMLVLGAPPMTTSCMVANQYSLDEDYASAVVFLSTVASMLTIPLLFLTIGLFR